MLRSLVGSEMCIRDRSRGMSKPVWRSTVPKHTPALDSVQLSLFDLEIWKPIPGYEGRYEASNQGRLRRVPGKRGRGYRRDPIVRTFVGDGGYIRTSIVRNGKQYKPGVH